MNQDIFKDGYKDFIFEGNIIIHKNDSEHSNQKQTNEAFSKKWKEVDEKVDYEKQRENQKRWYLSLYGFETVDNLKHFLSDKKIIFDAGCGIGYKAAWFASLSPETTVIAMDFSESVYIAAEKYKDIKNLFFIQGDIAQTPFKDNKFDYVNCDQVIMHTENPENTFSELARITNNKSGEFACYVYAKKALPRELVDDYFRLQCKHFSHDALMEMSEQLVTLGKNLSELNVKVEVPDIPLLGIQGGEYDIQRFIYWNFLKCYWNPETGHDISKIVNFDWYSPSNAKRYSKSEFMDMVHGSSLDVAYFHEEEACYSGRFVKKS